MYKQCGKNVFNDVATEDVCEKFDKARANAIKKREEFANGNGYPDPTAYAAMQKSNSEEQRFYKLLHTIFYIVKIAGFDLDGRIRLIDRRTGRIWE